MFCKKCNREISTENCHYCFREEIRNKYTDQYLYDNIVCIEYEDWDYENDKYDGVVPNRYVKIESLEDEWQIDVAGYVSRTNENFDEKEFQQMSITDQLWYRHTHQHLEYFEKSVRVFQIHDKYIQNYIFPMFFDAEVDLFAYGTHSFLYKWPTFEFYFDYLRAFENFSNEDLKEMQWDLSAFELIFTLRNGEKIRVSGVQNEFSDEFIENLTSNEFVYVRFLNEIGVSDWNEMFGTSLDEPFFNDDEINTIDHKGYMFQLGEGEYCRYSGGDSSTSGEYLCSGTYNKNQLLFQYVNIDNEVVNYVATILNNLPDFAFEYLISVLNERNDLAVRLTYIPGFQTAYEIYYDYCQDYSDVSSFIQWMGTHNDFAAHTYRYTQVVNGHQSCIGATDNFINYTKSDILYIYKGNIRCHRFEHNIIQVTAILHNKTDDEIELNVEYCTKCKKFLLEYTLFEQYRNRYGVLVGNFRMVVNGEFDSDYELADESPLMLSGYNVSQKDGYTSRERHYILARIIHDGIMSKGDVIRYLSYFIRKNGAKRGNELALSKWEEDLAFVQEYDIGVQPRAIISDVKKY